MTTILTDNYTDTAATLLSAHVANTGQTYTIHPSYSGPLAIAASGTALGFQSSGVAGGYYSSLVPSSADYNITGVILLGAVSIAGSGGITARMSTSANTFYHVRYNASNSSVEIYKFVAGTATLLPSGSKVVSWAASSSHTITLRMVGSGLAVDIDGTQQIPATAGTYLTDTSISAIGTCGVRAGAGTTNLFLDTLQVDTSSTPTLTPTGVASAEAFGTPTLLTIYALTPTGIASAEAFGTPTFAVTYILTPTGIPSAEAFGTPSVAASYSLSPTGIASAEAFGTPSLLATYTLSPTGVASAEAFGTPTLSTSSLSPTGIPSAEAFGSSTLSAAYSISVSGIPSAEAFGVPIIALPSVTVLYVDTPPILGHTYYYRWRASDGIFFSPYGPTVSASTNETPLQVMGLVAVGTPGEIVLTWTAIVNAATYNVYESLYPSDPAPALIASGLTTPTYTFFVTDTVLHYFHVSAVDDCGEGPLSAEVYAAALPQDHDCCSWASGADCEDVYGAGAECDTDWNSGATGDSTWSPTGPC